MRTAISTIQCDASVNKVAISDDSHHTLAIPFDNRHVRLYDLQVNASNVTSTNLNIDIVKSMRCILYIVL